MHEMSVMYATVTVSFILLVVLPNLSTTFHRYVLRRPPYHFYGRSHVLSAASLSTATSISSTPGIPVFPGTAKAYFPQVLRGVRDCKRFGIQVEFLSR